MKNNDNNADELLNDDEGIDFGTHKEKPRKIKGVGDIYSWKIYSCSGQVKAKNLTEAICLAVESFHGKKSKETIARFDMLIQKGDHKFY